MDFSPSVVFSRRLPLWTLLFAVGFHGSAMAEFAIPDQTDWVEKGVALTSGPVGSWDARLYGQISPCTVVKKGGIYFLYYRRSGWGSSHRRWPA